MSRFIGVVCGLRSEARVVARTTHRDRVRIAVSGADAGRAKALAAELCADGAAAIVSVGVSGALAPELTPGDILIGESVKTARGEGFDCDLELAAVLRTAVSQPAHPGKSRDERVEGEAIQSRGVRAVIFGSDDIIATAEEKARLFRDFGAVAVDMESHGAARAAKAAGVPFLAIRAIADPAHRALPRSALGAVAPDGSTRVLATLLKCAKAPGDFPALLQLGKDSDAALKTLGRDLGPLFGRLLLGLDL